MKLSINEYIFSAKEKMNVSFAFVSDLHNYPNGPILDAISSMDVDAILVGGDFIHNNFICERGFEFLSLASKILPTFCSLGNHEIGYLGDLRKRISKTGTILLDNDFVSFKGISIGGLTSGRFYPENQNQPNVDFLTDFSQLKEFKLLLCHHPEYYPKYIKDLPIDLTLSGHAHGGQWRFFGMGIYAPGQGIFPKYTSGVYEKRLVVSRGLGNLYLVPKINNPPEILKIKISNSY